jgi:hypothetical protein
VLEVPLLSGGFGQILLTCMYVCCMYVSMFGYPEAFQTLEVKLGCLGAQLLHGTRWAAAMAGVVW